MRELTNINYIKELLNKNNFRFSKSLGQNFLVNPSVCPKMADYAVWEDNMGVIEIGTGIGVLTKELALRAKKVVAIELDMSLMPILSETKPPKAFPPKTKNVISRLRAAPSFHGKLTALPPKALTATARMSKQTGSRPSFSDLQPEK